jgi:hypothetical protein
MNPTLVAFVDRLVCGGLDDGGVAEKRGITKDQLRHHLEVCAVSGTATAREFLLRYSPRQKTTHGDIQGTKGAFRNRR